ncbi:hypothetical protein SLA2020_421540 [Shorea laevis]
MTVKPLATAKSLATPGTREKVVGTGEKDLMNLESKEKVASTRNRSDRGAREGEESRDKMKHRELNLFP